MSLSQNVVHIAVYEGPGAEPLPSERRLAAISALLERGYPVSLTRDEISVPTQAATAIVVLGQFHRSSLPLKKLANESNAVPATDSTLALNVSFADITGLDAAQI